MNDIPRQKLQYIISQFGRVICDEPRRCEAMLRDLCPENKREINLLVGAAKERVAADLMTASDAVPKEILLARLTRRLYDNLGMAEEFAHWAVESWALALGVISPEPENIWTDPVTGMEFRYVPGGTFMMGDEYYVHETVHEVRLSGFYVGKYPVNQGQWKRVMGNNPSYFQKGSDYPVEQVSWNDAQEFIRKLAEMNRGRYDFRLPTEAEWEYAARSGGRKERYTDMQEIVRKLIEMNRGKYELRMPTKAEWEYAVRGGGKKGRYAGGDDIDAVAWYGENSGGSTHPVGKKAPNGFAIHDMSGNVWEWCGDWFGDYPSGPVKNPVGPSIGSSRVFRGGCWGNIAGYCRPAFRYRGLPATRSNNLGFRLVLLPNQQ